MYEEPVVEALSNTTRIPYEGTASPGVYLKWERNLPVGVAKYRVLRSTHIDGDLHDG